MKYNNLSFVVLIIVIACWGCAKKADPHKSIEKIQKEVQSMSVADLEKTAKVYADGIMAQKTELSRITDEMKGIPIQEIFSDKSKPIQKRLARVQSEAEALFERYQIYALKLKEKGGDLSKVQLD